MDERDRKLLEDIDGKVDQILIQIPTFVTWRKLGGAVATFATLVFAALKVLS